MRVLASAYACEPDRGSEPGIGWNFARQIALRHNLTLITRENNVADIQRAVLEEGLNIEVIGHDLPRHLRFWKRGSRGAMAYYLLWQKSLAAVAQRVAQRSSFDVAHHLTFASGWLPSGLVHTGLPFVFGPVGEHPRVPSEYLRPGDWRARAAEALRATARHQFPRIDPGVAATWKAADVILSLGSTFGDRIPESHKDRIVPMLAAGTETEAFFAPTPRAEDQPLRCAFAGRLVDLKGIRTALHAFAFAFAGGRETLAIYGDGPNRALLEELVRVLGVADQVQFHGHVDHSAAQEGMRAADVFLFPSFEGAGMVVPEAMAAGACVVCLEFGGPGEMVGNTRGIAVPLGTCVEATAREIGKALKNLAGDEAKRMELASKGHEWARRVTTWSAKGEMLEGVYQRALTTHAERNDQRPRKEAV